MNISDKCFAIFEENSGYDKVTAVNIAAKKLGIPIALAMKYYPSWRKSYTRRPMIYHERNNSHLPELTPELCFYECQRLGTGAKALRDIAERYNVNSVSLHWFLTKWGIRDKLKQMQHTRS